MIYDFGMRLKELREKKKMTQEQVARRLNLTKASISGYENNIASPSLDVLKQFCYLYHVSADYLLGIDNRKTIILDNLTSRQECIIEDIVDTLITEFKSK